MKKKIIPVIIAIVLILVIIGVTYGKELKEKYSYSSERADLNEYFQIYSTNEAAIIIGNELTENKALVENGHCYFPIDFVSEYFTDRFYVNLNENILLYTTQDTVYKASIGDDSEVCYENGQPVKADCKPTLLKEDTVYIEAGYVRKFANYSYELFSSPYRVRLKLEWGATQTAVVNEDTACRRLGGVKSPILKDIKLGEKVQVLEQMDTWAKVMTSDAIIGYVENAKLREPITETEIPVNDAIVPNYSYITKEGTISMGFCQLFGAAANETIESVLPASGIMNVLAPTWIRLLPDGSLENNTDASYVTMLNEKGMDVWIVATDVDYEVNLSDWMSTQEQRSSLISQLVGIATDSKAQGINIDFERVNSESAPHFIQFLRELSIATHAANLVLSVDNYVPTGGTSFYNRKEQGLVADYFIIMGYDEHWSGGEAGSVASIDFVKSGIEQTIQEVPAEKVINALPFYTRVWATENGTVTSEALGMKAAEEWFTKHSVEKVWDEQCCQYYGKYEEKQGDSIALYQMWQEENESIQAKLNVMYSNRIAGAAYWKLGLDKEDIWEVINAYVNKEQP